MKRLFNTFIFVISLIPVYSQENDSIRTHIEIEITDRPNTKQAILYETYTDIRFDIINAAEFVDGKCSIDYVSDSPRHLEIIFDDELSRGSWRNKQFYAEGDTVYCHATGEYGYEVESRGKLQTQSKQLAQYIDKSTDGLIDVYQDSLSSMYDTHQNYIPELRPVYEKIDKAKGAERDSLYNLVKEITEANNGESKSPEYKELYNKFVNLLNKADTLRWNQITDNEASLFGLMNIRQELGNESPYVDIDEAMAKIEEKFNSSYGAYKSHPYYEGCQKLFAGRKIKAGKPYNANYTIHGIDGSEAVMADLIKGRPAIIDLWASWCIPCRLTSKKLIPIYNKYTPRGLAYVAVAREPDDAKSMIAAAKEDGHPWESYADIDDADEIWLKNGCPNSGGRVILVGADGIIVAVDPDARTIEQYLSEHLPAE